MKYFYKHHHTGGSRQSMGERIVYRILLVAFLMTFANGQDEHIKITKDEIINNAWTAMFGDVKDEDLKSIYIEVSNNGKGISSIITIKRPNLFRNEHSDGTLVFDGKRAAWAKRAPDAEGNSRSPEMINPEHWLHFEVDIAIYMPAFFDYPSVLKGIRKYDGNKVYEIHVELPLGAAVSYFIDAETFLITRRHVRWNEDPLSTQEYVNTGNIDYGGILFPDGYTFRGTKIKYGNVKVNVKQENGFFEIPAELK